MVASQPLTKSKKLYHHSSHISLQIFQNPIKTVKDSAHPPVLNLEIPPATGTGKCSSQEGETSKALELSGFSLRKGIKTP